MVIMVTMKEASLAHAKAHLSEIVDAAEHRGVSTLIHRHGKPSAVVVPVEVGMPAKKKRRGMTPEEIAALHATFEGQGDPSFSAVEDLIAGRR
jgi:prevent-host-death family protein